MIRQERNKAYEYGSEVECSHGLPRVLGSIPSTTNRKGRAKN